MLGVILTCCALWSTRAAPQRSSWAQVRPALPHERVTVMFGLKQRNIDVLEQTVLEVSDPTHTRYGKHLTLSEVDALVSPSPETVNAVDSFLRSHGIEVLERSASGDFVRFDTTVSKLEALGNAKFAHYAHRGTAQNTTVMRCASFTLPKDIAAHVNVVSPSTRFPPPPRKPRQRVASSNGGTGTGPKEIRAAYNIGSFRGSAKGNSQAAVGFWWQEGQVDMNDTLQFWKAYDKQEVGTPFTIFGNESWPKHKYDPGSYGAEGALDAQYLSTTGASVPTTYMYFDGNAPGSSYEGIEPWMAFLYHVANLTSPPLVISASYGEDETDPTPEYADRVNVELQKLGARGISVLFASGDSGCQFAGEVSPEAEASPFMSSFPSSLPFATAVGGTEPTTPESVMGFSGGGFSTRYAAPKYQQDAISAYLKAAKGHLPSASRFNSSMRARPDVAAFGDGFFPVLGGSVTGVSGTSGSCPIAAGIFALLNDIRLAQGKAPLGFLNPLIYQNLDAFNDITTGELTAGCGGQGWRATTGWDPASGVGTPNFGKLKALVKSLP